MADERRDDLIKQLDEAIVTAREGGDAKKLFNLAFSQIKELHHISGALLNKLNEAIGVYPLTAKFLAKHYEDRNQYTYALAYYLKLLEANIYSAFTEYLSFCNKTGDTSLIVGAAQKFAAALNDSTSGITEKDFVTFFNRHINVQGVREAALALAKETNSQLIKEALLSTFKEEDSYIDIAKFLINSIEAEDDIRGKYAGMLLFLLNNGLNEDEINNLALVPRIYLRMFKVFGKNITLFEGINKHIEKCYGRRHNLTSWHWHSEILNELDPVYVKLLDDICLLETDVLKNILISLTHAELKYLIEAKNEVVFNFYFKENFDPSYYKNNDNYSIVRDKVEYLIQIKESFNPECIDRACHYLSMLIDLKCRNDNSTDIDPKLKRKRYHELQKKIHGLSEKNKMVKLSIDIHEIENNLMDINFVKETLAKIDTYITDEFDLENDMDQKVIEEYLGRLVDIYLNLLEFSKNNIEINSNFTLKVQEFLSNHKVNINPETNNKFQKKLAIGLGARVSSRDNILLRDLYIETLEKFISAGKLRYTTDLLNFYYDFSEKDTEDSTAKLIQVLLDMLANKNSDLGIKWINARIIEDTVNSYFRAQYSHALEKEKLNKLICLNNLGLIVENFPDRNESRDEYWRLLDKYENFLRKFVSTVSMEAERKELLENYYFQQKFKIFAYSYDKIEEVTNTAGQQIDTLTFTINVSREESATSFLKRRGLKPAMLGRIRYIQASWGKNPISNLGASLQASGNNPYAHQKLAQELVEQKPRTIPRARTTKRKESWYVRARRHFLEAARLFDCLGKENFSSEVIAELTRAAKDCRERASRLSGQCLSLSAGNNLAMLDSASQTFSFRLHNILQKGATKFLESDLSFLLLTDPFLYAQALVQMNKSAAYTPEIKEFINKKFKECFNLLDEGIQVRVKTAYPSLFILQGNDETSQVDDGLAATSTADTDDHGEAPHVPDYEHATDPIFDVRKTNFNADNQEQIKQKILSSHNQNEAFKHLISLFSFENEIQIGNGTNVISDSLSVFITILKSDELKANHVVTHLLSQIFDRIFPPTEESQNQTHCEELTRFFRTVSGELKNDFIAAAKTQCAKLKMHLGAYREAIRLLKEADSLVENPKTKMLLAQCYQEKQSTSTRRGIPLPLKNALPWNIQASNLYKKAAEYYARELEFVPDEFENDILSLIQVCKLTVGEGSQALNESLRDRGAASSQTLKQKQNGSQAKELEFYTLFNMVLTSDEIHATSFQAIASLYPNLLAKVVIKYSSAKDVLNEDVLRAACDALLDPEARFVLEDGLKQQLQDIFPPPGYSDAVAGPA